MDENFNINKLVSTLIEGSPEDPLLGRVALFVLMVVFIWFVAVLIRFLRRGKKSRSGKEIQDIREKARRRL